MLFFCCLRPCNLPTVWYIEQCGFLVWIQGWERWTQRWANGKVTGICLKNWLRNLGERRRNFLLLRVSFPLSSTNPREPIPLPALGVFLHYPSLKFNSTCQETLVLGHRFLNPTAPSEVLSKAISNSDSIPGGLCHIRVSVLWEPRQCWSSLDTSRVSACLWHC